MPELPEIETIKTGLQSLIGQKILAVKIHNPSLRYKVDNNLENKLKNKSIVSITRRAKYLIFTLTNGYLIIHLGMSGSISLKDKFAEHQLQKHEHVEIFFTDFTLRYNDPRRFGAIIHTNDAPFHHSLLNTLGPEPLTSSFTEQYLLTQLKKRKTTIKQAVMDNQIVVGVGNIYACEALFLSKILPYRPALSITKLETRKLVENIKSVLTLAIQLGGSSLRDYKQVNDATGKFQTVHNVYGKTGKNCPTCGNIIKEIRLGQRNSFYCPGCQK